MKRTLFSIILIPCSLYTLSQTKDAICIQEDTVILKQDTTKQTLLTSVNLKYYIGKTVDELLQNDTIKTHESYWWTDEPPGKLESLNLTFARGLYLKIYPAKRKGQAVQFSITNDFDFEAFKKLKIQELVMDRDHFEEEVKNSKQK